MATSAEHKAEAEQLLTEARDIHQRLISRELPPSHKDVFGRLLFLADTHAVLATVPDPVQVMSVEDWNKIQQKD